MGREGSGEGGKTKKQKIEKHRGRRGQPVLTGSKGY